jgi:two-component system chemotaxis sensor kinase CheA
METGADRAVLQALKDPLMHVLRNAICHGIEPSQERVVVGKSPEGIVILHIEATGNRLVIEIEDDGRGVDLARVTELAVRQGLVSESEARACPSDELLNVLVRPGFSTCDAVNELAGRGLGLSVAHETVTRLQGEITVRPRAGAGTIVSLSVPLAVSTHRVLMVSCQGQTFGIPLAGIKNACRLERQKLESLEGRPMVSLQGQLMPLFTLAQLLELADADAPLEADLLQLVVLKTGPRRIAVVVDALLLERNAVIQRLGPPAAHMSRFAGGILQEDGSVSLVLNPAELIERSKQSTRPICFKRTKADATPSPTILVVDDSFTTRTLETNILESHGYQVRVAIDGVEALNQLRAERVDLVISDVQMPRLDGFGLLAEIKKDPSLAQIPVIIVSSMDRREDQERGLSLGADAYLVKQEFEHQQLLQTIQQIV